VSKLHRRLQSAARRECFAFRRGVYGVVDCPQKWDVYVEAEGPIGPRGLSLTKRQAVALAYSIAVSKRYEIEVIYETPPMPDNAAIQGETK
jgi:hypothetical protein